MSIYDRPWQENTTMKIEHTDGTVTNLMVDSDIETKNFMKGDKLIIDNLTWPGPLILTATSNEADFIVKHIEMRIGER